MEMSVFWNQVDREIAKYDLLQHPFYQAWSAGELTTRDLKFYGEQYFHQVSAFPTYLTRLHSRLPDGAMRREVLANAFDEETEPCPHSELWLRFVEGMGATEPASTESRPIPEVAALVKTFRVNRRRRAHRRGLRSAIRLRVSGPANRFRKTQWTQTALRRGRPHLQLLRFAHEGGRSPLKRLAEDHFGVGGTGRTPRRGSAGRRFPGRARSVDCPRWNRTRAVNCREAWASQ